MRSLYSSKGAAYWTAFSSRAVFDKTDAISAGGDLPPRVVPPSKLEPELCGVQRLGDAGRNSYLVARTPL